MLISVGVLCEFNIMPDLYILEGERAFCQFLISFVFWLKAIVFLMARGKGINISLFLDWCHMRIISLSTVTSWHKIWNISPLTMLFFYAVTHPNIFVLTSSFSSFIVSSCSLIWLYLDIFSFSRGIIYVWHKYFLI